MSDDDVDGTAGARRELSAVADAMAGTDEVSMESWRAETAVWETVLADADYVRSPPAGHTWAGEMDVVVTGHAVVDQAGET